MSEETDALNNRIRVLENQVADMQRLVQDTSDLLDIARANGLDKFLTGHGLVEYGGGTMRLDQNGIQVLTQTPLTNAIWFVNTSLKHTPDVGQGYGLGQLYSNATDSQPIIALRVVDSSSNSNKIQILTDTAGTNEKITIDAPLVLANYATEPSTAEPGKVLYKTSTNKYRAYDGGTAAWENLATETFVGAGGVSTGFADHFLVMGG